MLLDLAEPGIQARITLLKGDRVRLVLDYPSEAPYRDKVLSALSEILRPATPQPPRPRGRPRTRTDEKAELHV